MTGVLMEWRGAEQKMSQLSAETRKNVLEASEERSTIPQGNRAILFIDQLHFLYLLIKCVES